MCVCVCMRMLGHFSCVWLFVTGSSVQEILQVRILEWVAMPSSRDSSQPRDQTCIFCCCYCIAGGFFTSKAIIEAHGSVQIENISIITEHSAGECCKIRNACSLSIPQPQGRAEENRTPLDPIAHLCMKCFCGISNFIEEISNLSYSIIFLYFFALITEEGFLISPCYSLELFIQIGISFLFSFAFHFSSFHRYL